MLRSTLPICLLVACAPSQPTAKPASTPAGSASAPTPSCAEVDSIAARVDAEWGTQEAPRFAFVGLVADVSKRVEAHDKQRRAYVDELRPYASSATCAASAHVRIGVVDDIFRAAVLRAKLTVIPADAEGKLVELETKANVTLHDPSSSPQQIENAKTLLEKTKALRENAAETAKTALKAWSAYAEMELIDAYARGMIEARKSGLKGSIYAGAWRRMGAIVTEVGSAVVNERLAQVKKDHPDVALDASMFQSACTWPAGC